MIQLLKKNKIKKNKIFLKSILGQINIFFIDKKFLIPKNIKIKIKKNKIFFKSSLGFLDFKYTSQVQFIHKQNYLFLFLLKEKKKNIINLYNQLIKIKFKGLLQVYKLNLILKGIGFKSLIENQYLILKIGYNHNIKFLIPNTIQIINQGNNLIFYSIDYIFLTQFVYFIKNHKKPEPYNGKGLLFKNEKILKKEGKKNKK